MMQAGGNWEAPANVAATDGTYAAYVRVTWSGVAGAETYEVLRAETEAGGKSLVGTTATTGFNDSTAQAGQTYYYFIRAAEGGTYSYYSAYDTGWRKLSPPVNVRRRAMGRMRRTCG